jgi:anti-sigma B factor antagonist
VTDGVSAPEVEEREVTMGLGPQLVLETTRIGSHDVIVVSGEIDLASAPKVESAIEGFSGQPVVLDLRKVDFMDSAGLKVLLNQRARLEESGGNLRLVVGEGAVVRLLELTGVTDAFAITSTIDE